ncbi:MAG: hypothetical protein IKQ69_06535 [Oscillospiraceae bacterium]|nr:hypothetical protein [Oscillospiraceae bacterium]
MGKNGAPLRYFLGANTADGFYSCYEDFPPREDACLWYIKGGPGNGKSTLMRSVARAAGNLGMQAECALCSGDPDSLDGVYLREARLGYVDATSPHVQEPGEPGAGGQYLDMSGCYRPGLAAHREQIREFFRLYREQYARSYALLDAAALAAPELIPGLVGAADRAGAAERADAMISGLVRPEGGYRAQRRFLSVYSCKGRLSLWDEVEAERFFTLDDRFGLADAFLQALRARCRESGCRVILCPDPLRPSRLEGLILPEQSIAFAAVKDPGRSPRPGGAHVPLAAAAGEDALRSREFLGCRETRDRLLQQAVGALRKAKDLHDRLEALYRPYVDFSAVDALIREQLERL